MERSDRNEDMTAAVIAKNLRQLVRIAGTEQEQRYQADIIERAAEILGGADIFRQKEFERSLAQGIELLRSKQEERGNMYVFVLELNTAFQEALVKKDRLPVARPDNAVIYSAQKKTAGDISAFIEMHIPDSFEEESAS